jgi:REP element-mobilizing transposase RayT
MNRGDRREPSVRDDEDRTRFLSTLGEACSKAGWQVQAYCLMENHFHLVVETPEPNLVAGMKWFLGTYTGRFNRRHKLFGHLFSGRYKALVVDGSGNGYLKTVCDYVHLNPARAKLVGGGCALEGFCVEQLAGVFAGPVEASSVVAGLPAGRHVDWLLGEWGIPKDSPAGRQRLKQALEERRGAEEGEEFKPIRRGWCLGEETFRQELLAQMNERIGAEHYGEERTESAEALAEQIIAEELKRRRWREAELQTKAKGDAEKVALAARLRAETTMTVGWIAERLGMGTRGHLNHLLYRRRQSRGE